MDDANEDIVWLEGENGSYPCKLLSIFELDGQEYALFFKLDLDLDDGPSTLTITRVATHGEEAVFHSIKDNEEFERVMAHLRALG